MKLKYNYSTIISVLVIFFIGCNSKSDDVKERTTEPEIKANVHQVEIEHAKNFKVTYGENYKVVDVYNAWKNTKDNFQYVLVQKGTEVPEKFKKEQIIKIPLDNIVCFSTTHIPYLDFIGESDKLIGFPNTDYVSSEKVRELIDAGKVTDLGSETNVNVERIISLNPEMIMAYGMGDNTDQFYKIEQSGIPVVFNADYTEQSPLGRAEWLKFTSLFFNQEKKADSIFNRIIHYYDTLKKTAFSAKKKPSVYSGIVYGDTWFMPGGKNYAAQFFEDANANYLWENNTEKSYLELSFEAVYEKAHQAEYWVGVGLYSSLDEIRNADHRYASFKAFKEGNVYNFSGKIGATGGNEYFELGYARPDLILADLIKIFHSPLLPDHELYFHKRLTR